MFVSYAQNFEDVILNRIFKDKESGFYIDVGAHHPIYDSITKAFYNRGWRGINIEPVSEFFQLLQQDRPDDINLPLAVGEQAAQLEFFELQGSGSSTLNRDTAIELAATRKLPLSCYKVTVTTLADICQKYVHSPIDFLKIDVEGWEEQVVAGNDWNSFRPTVIIIEATIPDSPIRRQTNIPHFLQEKGYNLVYFDGLNDYYLSEESKGLSCHFQTPVNVFDDFISFRIDDLTKQINSLNQECQTRDKKIVILSNSLADERFETERLSQAVKTINSLKDEQLEHYQNQVSAMQTLVAQSQKNLSQAKEKIIAMETSKFWKLRNLWFRLKS